MTWSSLPSELAAFADELAKRPETESASRDIRRTHALFKSSWKSRRELVSDRDGIQIPPPRAQSLHPRNCHPVESVLHFDFAISDEEPSFCPRSAQFQVVTRGLLDVRGQGRSIELEDHWRIDTDKHAGQGVPKEPHPLFHFQRGGHALDDFADGPGFVPGPSLPASGSAWTGLLQAPGPRMFTPPMCPLLMIDFAISQHDGTVWRRLRAQVGYLRMIEKAQDRLWVPFLASLSDAGHRRRWFGGLI